ncbi:DNA-binding response regulator [Porphyrobacter sp. HT-58-2]|uniref:response regulator n=1 Tax=Porphyrobacter sp. HT-58-2 TaxID=2023229 RepID=UPI000CDBBD41|nr:response regulator transcription factor [Porphyrobacter sp. HT-58-2]AUX70448.1 DNA-binding response regulator [Porphyrobacter sp. HT-58-2]
MSLRVLILEDHADMRAWLTGVVLEAAPDARILTAPDMRTALDLLAQHESFDLALVDLGLPDGSGLEVLRAIKAKSPQTLACVATILGNDTTVVAALAAGADGYLLKDQTSALLVRQIRQMLDGVPALSPAIARRIMTHFRNTGPVTEEAELTPREREVLGHIGKGLRNHEVAGLLGIGTNTVAAHIKAVYAKLGISSRAEAAWHATKLGL